MSKRPVFLFTFANDAQHSLQLDEEWRQLERSLQADNDAGKLIFNLTPSAKKEDLWDKFNRFHNQIAVFHYGGHSDEEGLFLMKEKLHGKSLATLLGQEANLQLVFLNGCSNVAQVQQLLDEGVPAVIATEAPVHDHRAVQLARQFYQALSSGRTIREAFDVAAAYVNNAEEEVLVEYRGVGFVEQGGEVFPWGLYMREESVLSWKVLKQEKTKWSWWEYVVAVGVIVGILGGLAEVLNFIDVFPGRRSGNTAESITVLVHGKEGKDDLVLPGRGVVYLIYGDAKTPEPVNQKGEATFKQIPSIYFEEDATVELLFEDPEGEAYRAVNPDSSYHLTRGQYIALEVQLQGIERVEGIVKDFISGEPVDSAEIRIRGLSFFSNEHGEFTIQIPEDQQQPFIDISATKEGYERYELSKVPTATEQQMVIPLKPKNEQK